MKRKRLSCMAEAKERSKFHVGKMQQKKSFACGQKGSLAGINPRTGNIPTDSTFASILDRATGSRPHGARRSLLQLQRTYGNRFVQKLLTLARKGESHSEVAPEMEQAIDGARGAGHGLDGGVCNQMENAFDTDFSGVRVHTDSRADVLNHVLNARAFTTGQDIFFRRGEYKPESSSGKELLAHELTHVVQQGGGNIQGKLSVSRPGDPYERSADRVAKEIVRQQSLSPQECGCPHGQGCADMVPGGVPEPAKLPDGEVVFEHGLMRYKDPTLEQQVQTAPHHRSLGNSGLQSLIQRFGECDGKTVGNCSGRCEPSPGRGMTGVCQWGGVTYGCRCRDRSGDAPPPAGTAAAAETGTRASPIQYEGPMKNRSWSWQIGDEDWFSTQWAARFQVAAKFGKISWGSGVAWVLDEVNASKQTFTGLSGEVHNISSRYYIIGGQLQFTLRMQLRFKTSDVTERESSTVGTTLSAGEKTSIGASVPVEGVEVSAGAESSRGAGLNLSKTWGSERVLSGSTFDVTREFTYSNNGVLCVPRLTESFSPDTSMIGDVPGLESWIRGSPDWTISHNDLFFGLPML